MLTGTTNREQIRPLVNGRITPAISTKDQAVWIEFNKYQSWLRTMIGDGWGLFASIMVINQPRIVAHEEGAPFSGAIIDPPILHHAHIENEQRLNFFALRGVRDANGRKRTAYETELELAYGSPNFRYGFEIFVPFASQPAPALDADRRVTGIGDMEVRPLKYALLMKPDFVISTASGFGLPTGSRVDGLGEGNTSFSQYLFVDKAQGNWAVLANLGLGTNLRGEQDSWFEYGAGLSYSSIRGVKFGEVAPVRPPQNWVVTPSVELVGEHSFRGSTVGQHTTSLALGLSFWHVRSGWQIRLGVQLPSLASGKLIQCSCSRSVTT